MFACLSECILYPSFFINRYIVGLSAIIPCQSKSAASYLNYSGTATHFGPDPFDYFTFFGKERVDAEVFLASQKRKPDRYIKYISIPICESFLIATFRRSKSFSRVGQSASLMGILLGLIFMKTLSHTYF